MTCGHDAPRTRAPRTRDKRGHLEREKERGRHVEEDGRTAQTSGRGRSTYDRWSAVLAADPDFLRTTRAYSRVQPAFRIPPPSPFNTFGLRSPISRSRALLPSFLLSINLDRSLRHSISLATNVILLLLVKLCIHILCRNDNSP